MPKKKKDGGDAGGDGKEKPPNEKEQLLLHEVQALNEQLAQAKGDAAKYKVGYDELTNKLKKQEIDRNDQAEYLKHELEKTRMEVSTLQDKFLALEQSKESLQRRMEKEKAEAAEKQSQSEGDLSYANSEVERLSGLLTELGNLRTNAEKDSHLKTNLYGELEDVKNKLGEKTKQLKVLSTAEGHDATDDGARVVPLMLLEAISQHVPKPVLVEQAMVGLQYVLSSDRHADAELIRRRGGIEILLQCMELHHDIGDLQSAACGLLWKLAFADVPVREVIVENNGIALIMGSMQRHSAHPRLNYNACGALRHLLVSSPVKLSDASTIPGSRAHDSALPPIAGGPRGGRSSMGRRSRDKLSNVPIGAPPRMLLAGGGSSSRSGLRGVSSNPDLAGGPRAAQL